MKNEQEWLMEAPIDNFRQFNYFKVDNEYIEANVVARMIADNFAFKVYSYNQP